MQCLLTLHLSVKQYFVMSQLFAIFRLEKIRCKVLERQPFFLLWKTTPAPAWRQWNWWYVRCQLKFKHNLSRLTCTLEQKIGTESSVPFPCLFSRVEIGIFKTESCSLYFSGHNGQPGIPRYIERTPGHSTWYQGLSRWFRWSYWETQRTSGSDEDLEKLHRE